MKNKPHGTKRKRRRNLVTPGSAPGIITADPTASPPRIRAIAYSPEAFEEHEIEDVRQIRELTGRWPMVWINVDGVRHAPTLTALQELFALHPLAVEDIVHVNQRPKVDIYDAHLFTVVRMVAPELADYTEQIACCVGKGYVLSFQEQPGDCFESVRERIRVGKGRIRHAGADYLLYALVDAVVDSYFPWLERVTARLEDLETRVFADPDKEIIAALQSIRRELREIRRANLPHRDVVSALLRDETPVIREGTHVYLKDCADHAARVSDMVDTARDESTDLMHAYLSSVSNRMNEVMKVLTIVAAVFIPLGFIAGLYGMNFDLNSPWNMPELGWRYGYLAVVSLMVIIAGGLLLFFKKKRWF